MSFLHILVVKTKQTNVVRKLRGICP